MYVKKLNKNNLCSVNNNLTFGNVFLKCVTKTGSLMFPSSSARAIR
jgi:hypothetical protein